MQSLKRQPLLFITLLLQAIVVFIYTAYVGLQDGWIFIEVAITNLTSLTWNGQFTADFSCYLLLSGLWIMWRNKFSISSIFIALFAMVLGIIIFAPYFIWLLYNEKGNLIKVLIGTRN
ncbi:hypothetical protein WAF17_19275 [Bernardetia sp. ABR2-2B]|uniref:hypothetical protein n=1 Tax=Bernardetia sp. ABR2-2B TaxID=3127472 RepID=UPI0030CCB30C